MIFKILKDLGYPIAENVQAYYKKIGFWQDWWRGYVPTFHKYTIKADGSAGVTVKRKQMRMAKKVCEDWANLLLNDKTRILVDGDQNTQVFLTGDKDEQNGGVFGDSKFWKLGNQAIEREFAQGTICFYIQLTGASLTADERLQASGLKIKAIKDAKKIIPLTYEDDDISEIALASTMVSKGQEILYVQVFKAAEDGAYEIENHWFQVKGDSYSPIPAPAGEAQSYRLPCKPFVILRPNLENNVDDVPLGVSVYANAIDNLESCDLAFDNLFMDTLLGKKRVFMNQAAVITRPAAFAIGEDGVERAIRQEPDIGSSLEKTLYITTDEKLPGDQQFFQEYNPDLRVDANKTNIQFNLNLLSSKVGLGQRRYSFEAANMATATEVKASNKDLTESVWRQRVTIQEALENLVRAVLIIGRDKCGAQVDTEAKISIQFDDTIFSDEEAERMRMLQEISSGVAQRWEYRVKYYGEDEEEARQMTGETTENDQQTMAEAFFNNQPKTPETAQKEGPGEDNA